MRTGVTGSSPSPNTRTPSRYRILKSRKKLRNTIFIFNSAGPPRAEQQPLCVRQGLQAHRGVLGGEQEGPQRQVIFFESAFPFFQISMGKTLVGQLIIGFSSILCSFSGKSACRSRGRTTPTSRAKAPVTKHREEERECNKSRCVRFPTPISFRSILSPFLRKVPFRRKSEKSPLSAEEKKDFMGAVNNPKNRKMPSHIGEKVSRKCSTPKK